MSIALDRLERLASRHDERNPKPQRATDPRAADKLRANIAARIAAMQPKEPKP